MAGPSASPPALDPQFVRRAFFILLLGVGVLLAWRLTHVLLLIFGAVLIAVLLRTIAEPIQRYLRLPQRWAVLAALVGVFAFLGLAGWLFGRQIDAQLSSLSERLPLAWETVQSRLETLPYGREIVARLNELEPSSGAGGAGSDMLGSGVFSGARAVAATLMTGLGELILVIFAGLFLALNPQSYRDGLLRLAPTGGLKDKMGRAFDVSGEGLKRWLLGQLISMLLIGVLVTLGTWAIGLPSPLALGLFAGMLEFVPIVGPTLAFIPAFLLALLEGPDAVLWTVLLYVIIQQIEGNLIMPLVQKRMLTLPPVLTLFAILAFAALFGPIGILFATPLAVIIYLLVRTLYLGEDSDAAMGIKDD
ncbi:AI-2E family transporter [Brevundimonas sp. 2R-24]|uniref:AI-2E family transporter n=1 Tax=Peiella sedimenti TaxID=3061083 RepID=A0ABT8SQH8_9CAUL|nr:AI-2E family transporter [Caulobacteraceae bacterium XZ-24]